MIEVIKDRTAALMDNFRRTVLTADLDYRLYNQPLSKHIYHALYWFDYWCCAPENYIGAEFHTDDLVSLDTESKYRITQQDLLTYLERVRLKTVDYLNHLTMDMLEEIPENCADKTRFALILGQFAHCYIHIGNINSVTISQTGKWVYIPNRERDLSKPLFDE